MTTTRSPTVTGMTCQHCVASVTEEVQTVAGVTAVDLATGRLDVTGDVDDASVVASVEEAGYEASGS